MEYGSMKSLLVSSIIILTALAANPAHAQETTVTPEEHSVFSDYLNPPPTGTGFLRIPGLDFRSSLGFSYASSSSFGDVGMGYYMGHFSYRLGSTLTLNWNVGVGSYMTGPDGMNDYQVFIPNFDVTWRPSENMIVKLQYLQGGYLNPYFYRRGPGF